MHSRFRIPKVDSGGLLESGTWPLESRIIGSGTLGDRGNPLAHFFVRPDSSGRTITVDGTEEVVSGSGAAIRGVWVAVVSKTRPRRPSHRPWSRRRDHSHPLAFLCSPQAW